MSERMTDEDFERRAYGVDRDAGWVVTEARRARESEARLLGVMKQAASVFVVETEPPTQGEPVLVGDAYHVTMTWPVKVRSLSIEEAKAAEREACAEAVDVLAESWKSSTSMVDPVQAFTVAAGAIRGRSK